MNLRKGQHFAEYAILIAVVLSAIIGMQLYVQRTLQARYHTGSRYLISKMQEAAGNSALPSQYEPYYTQSNFIMERQSNMQENLFGRTDINRYTNELAEKRGRQAVLPGCAAEGPGGCLGVPKLCPFCGKVRCCPPKVCVGGKTCE